MTKKTQVSNGMSQVKGAAVAVVALVIGLVIGLFIPFGEVTPPSTITKVETVTPTFFGATSWTTTEMATVKATATVRTTLVESIRSTVEEVVTGTQTVKMTSTVKTTVSVTVPPEKPVVLLEHRGYTRRDYAYVEGIIQNQDTVLHEFIEVMIAWYDAAGKLVYTDWTYADPHTLQPGEKATFKTMTEAQTPVQTYDVINITYD